MVACCWQCRNNIHFIFNLYLTRNKRLNEIKNLFLKSVRAKKGSSTNNTVADKKQTNNLK